VAVTRAASLLAVAVALLVAGCGDDASSETTTGTDTTSVSVYFLRDGKVWPVRREVEETDLLNAAYRSLRQGPTQAERDIGLTTDVPEDESEDLSDAALAQIVYTATQFASVDSAEIDGVHYTRADFEKQTPSVLVESPLPLDEVESPFRVSGTANTFEATFQYELVDSDGNALGENFVTATSGTGTRGTFFFTTEAFDDVAALRVFERSAEDGSRVNEVEIPLRTAQ
jgi:Immunoglobulin-like domain of bacterial spore germination